MHATLTAETPNETQLDNRIATRMNDDADRPLVLIADGNATVRKILRHMLGGMECDVVEAGTAEKLLELARCRPYPKAMIVDGRLPGGSGFDACSELKTEEQFQLTPIILMMDSDATEEKLKALECGADDILRKPINRGELTFRVRSLLRIQRFNHELIGAESVAMALARAVAAKDGYSHSHVEQVAGLSVKLARAVGLDPAEQKLIRYGAILHNVGKISIPDAVLEKTGPLSPREMAMFQQHPRVGCDICAPLKPLKDVVPIIRHHKERWNGTGFPDGLRGNEIPLGAQIVGLVDAYVALASRRPYRQAIEKEDVVTELQNQASKGWHNSALVEQFIEGVLELESPANLAAIDDGE
ncbi:MAG: response regulator [Planctomycetota bacterium]|nr:response regulator [Planctomycetota bacterium]